MQSRQKFGWRRKFLDRHRDARNYLKEGHAKSLGLLFLLCCLANQSLANTEEVVPSHVSGGVPYLIVYEDSVGSSGRAPGVYVRGKEDEPWVLAVAGRLKSPLKTGGFHAHLGMAKRTGRAEVVAVVDGKIKVFSVQSRPEREGSVFTLGDLGPGELKVPGESRRFSLPPIESIEDVHVFSQSIEVNSEQYEVVLISQKFEQIIGNGVSYALVLPIWQNTSTKIVPHYDPIVLNWSFLPMQELASLLFTGNASTGPYFLLSKLLIEKYTQPNPLDSLVISNWKNRVSKALDQGIAEGAIYNGLYKELPLVDVLSGDLEILSMPQAQGWDSKQNSGAVIFDPIRGRHGIYLGQNMEVSYSKLNKIRPLLPGSVQCRHDGRACIDELSLKSASDGALRLVKMEDGNLLAVYLSEVGPSIVPIRPVDKKVREKPVKEVSWLLRKDELLFASFRFADGSSQTCVYQFDTRKGILNLTGAASFSNEFYTPVQLQWRFQDGANGFKHALFDDTTENVEDESAYKSLRNMRLPIVDIDETLKERAVRYHYPEPKLSLPLHERVRYVEYEKVPGIPSKTGIYIGADGSEEIMPGQLIREHPLLTETGALDAVSFNYGEKETPLFAKAWLVDPKNSSELTPETAVRIAVTLGMNASGEIKPKGTWISDAFNLGDLKGFQLFIRAPRTAEKEYEKVNRPILVYGFMAFKAETKAFSFTFEKKSKDGVFEIERNKASTIAKFELSKDELAHRLRFSAESPVLVLTDTLPEDHKDLKVFSFTEHSDVYPNRETGDRYFLAVADDEESFKGRYKQNFWSGYAKSQIYDRSRKLTNATEYASEIFPDLAGLLEGLADSERKPRHVVLIVPPDLKSYAENYPYAVFQRKGRSENWNDRNRKLRPLFIDPDHASQADAIYAFETARSSGQNRGERVVFLSTLDQVRKLGRPKTDKSSGFQLKEKIVATAELISQQLDISEDEIEEAEETARSEKEAGITDDGEEKRADPHLLYLLATEGRAIPLTGFRPDLPTTFSQLLIGTEEEWKALKEQAKLESERHLFNHFEVVELSQSTPQVRREMILRIIRSPAFKELGLEVDVSDIVRDRPKSQVGPREAEEILAQHLVNRIESLAVGSRVPGFTGFMRVLSSFERELRGYGELRRRGVLNRASLEVLLSKTFPMPLHISLLPPDDPLRVMSDPKFVLKWRRLGGHDAPLQVLDEYRKNKLSQLTNDTTRSKIQSSSIVFGETGSGKTSLLRSFFRVLGFVEYDFDHPENNENARVFFLSAAQLVDGGVGKGGSSHKIMTVKEAEEHLEEFLLLPNGPRGYIVIDDFHLLNSEQREVFVKKIRVLLENDFINIEGVEIPTRNLSLDITLNPTPDLSTIERYTKDKKAGPTDVELLLATLNDGKREKSGVDEALLKRFGGFIKINRFPKSAKAPALQRNLLQTTESDFTNEGVYTLVSPRSVARLTEEFPEMDARSFLSSGARALTRIETESGHRLMIVVPAMDHRHASLNPLGSGTRGFVASGQSEAADIEQFVRKSIQKLPIENSALGQIHFLEFLINNFRKRVFEVVLSSVWEDERYFLNMEYQKEVAGVLARAVHDHLLTFPAFPLEELSLTYSEFASSGGERNRYKQAFMSLKKQQELTQRALPVRVGNPELGELFSQSGSSEGDGEDTRQKVLRTAVQNLQGTVQGMLNQWLYVADVFHPPVLADWLQTIPMVEPKWFDLFGPGFTDSLVRYLNEIYGWSVRSNHAVGLELSRYDAMRFFVMALDRAIGFLPWSKATVFVMDGLRTATSNLMYGQSQNVQHLLFKGRSSPVIDTDPFFVLELAKSHPHFGDVKQNLSDYSRHTRFLASCSELLVDKKQTGRISE